MNTGRTQLAAVALALAVVSCAAAPSSAPPPTPPPSASSESQSTTSAGSRPGRPADRTVADDRSVRHTSGIASTVESIDDGSGGDGGGPTVAITYTDVAGAARTIRAELRLPDGSARDGAPLPVVVWSHGGSRGFGRTDRVGEQWGRAMNRAGFAFVAVAHAGRDDASRTDVCDAVDAVDCPTFNTLFWDRPHDIGVTLDWVGAVADRHGLDADRLVYAGHSAGATGALTVAGMDWVFGSELRPPTDPRPVGFIASSPPGATARGFDVGTFDALDRPVLVMTGLGDTTASTTAADRIATIDLLPEELPAAAVWIDRGEARHGVFNLKAAPCRRAGGSDADCRSMVRTIADVATSFVREVTGAGFVPAGFDGRLRSPLPSWATLR